MTSPARDGIVLSSSPTSMRGGSPVRRRDESAGSSSNARISPTTNPRISPIVDADFLERQRTMDVDMALHLSRARRETITAAASPVVASSGHPSAAVEIPALSASERRDMRYHDIDNDEAGLDIGLDISGMDSSTERPSTPVDLRMHLDHNHDPALLTRPHDDLSAGLPTYQANPPHPQTLPTLAHAPSAFRSQFDFSHLEAFSVQEKAALGIGSPGVIGVGGIRLRQATSTSADATSPRQSWPHRKLSQSSPVPRASRKGIRGKMALFENTPSDPPPLSAIPSAENINAAPPYLSTSPYLPTQSQPRSPPFAQAQSQSHARPYRFSFYSNALSATIHARSLSELPADGQSFEELFNGVGGAGGGAPGMPKTPDPGVDSQGYFGQPSDAGTSTANKSNKLGYPDDGAEGNTWWLDVQSPTDEEMKVLSKVFQIHPLTSEDIQMEESREKIELFRTYYLVCFRSFDQDPYSPTHLEPLNMYVVVFREGILSFHHRPTPHPQNVRRRIKQLKDYISVTADWISYALIDDITDAFGPLIRGIEYEVDAIDELVLIINNSEVGGGGGSGGGYQNNGYAVGYPNGNNDGESKSFRGLFGFGRGKHAKHAPAPALEYTQHDSTSMNRSDMLRRIGTCRKKVMGLLRLMGNKADVVKGLAKRCNENWRVAPTGDIGLYLSDIQDHLITMTQNLNHYEKILSRSHSNYLAQISIEMTDANNQINDVLSKLTALGTVLIPMNLITGIWGMNVHVPGQNLDGYGWFAAIVAALAAIAIIGGYTTYKLMTRR